MRNPWQQFRQNVRKSGFAVGTVRAARAGVLDIKQLYWWFIRGGRIRNYLRSNSVKKLQLGASVTPLHGWLNTDLIPEVPGVVYLDATRRFPFEDGTLDYIFCEHMIEHIDHDGGMAMLRESFRVLKPGGTIRLATPDLKILLGLSAREKTPMQNEYIECIVSSLFPEVTDCKATFVINNAFRFWGHQFLYDAETLKATLARCGFRDFKVFQAGESDDINLHDIESHGKRMGNEAINRFETLVVEARVPLKKNQEMDPVSEPFETEAIERRLLSANRN